MDYKPGMFGTIKELQQKARQNARETRFHDQDAVIPELSLNTTESKEEGKKKEAPVKAPATKRQKNREAKMDTNRQKDASIRETSPANKPSLSNGIEDLWSAAKASKANKKLKESQVWIDESLYRQIEMLNIKSGKPVPTKHVVNAILKLYLDEHKTEIAKAQRT